MKKLVVFAVVAIVALVSIAIACPIAPACPIHDGSTGYFTSYKYVDGVQLGVYHCSRGHDFLVRCD